MFLNKAAMITLSTLFLVVGCVSTVDPVQEAKIIKLERDLTLSKNIEENNYRALFKTKIELKQTKMKLENTTILLDKTKIDLIKKQKETIALNKKIKKTIKNQKKKSNSKSRYLDKVVFGQVEWIYINKTQQNFKARIDTGAATSSINARDMERFERDGKKWVRFNMTHLDNSPAQIIEAPIERTVRIIQTSEGDSHEKRPVIKLKVRIGNTIYYSEFTLTDRIHMKYPILIGRSFIQDVAVVDVSQEYIQPEYQIQDKE